MTTAHPHKKELDRDDLPCALCGLYAGPKENTSVITDQATGHSLTRREHIACAKAAVDHADGPETSDRLITQFRRRYYR